MSDRRLIVGAMSGTSLDGLDVVAVSIDGRGLDLRAEVVADHCEDLGDLAAPLRALVGGEPRPVAAIAALARALALRHVRAIDVLLAGRRPDLVAVHGQTVFHAPPLSCQLVDLSVIAHGLGCATVGDLRAADLACGGQGAPITPLADWLLLRHSERDRVVVNLGGFVNLTVLPAGGGPETVRGRDVCAGNQLLDAVARHRLDAPFDRDGTAASAGVVRLALRDALVARLRRQAAAGRSLGSGDEPDAWDLGAPHEAAADVCASAVAALTAVVGAAVRAAGAEEVVLAGGGASNQALVAALTEALAPVPVSLLSAHGLAVQQREAAAMAVLAALCQDRVPITLPAVTGVAQAPVAGVWVLP